MTAVQTALGGAGAASTGELQRRIGWRDAFWIASGVPALVLFSVGSIAATVGTPSWLVWMISISMGFVQAFTYAEIAGLFPNKSGGASVYGAVAWVRYGKLFAPLSVWCNWLAWSPVLAIGAGLAAGYVLSLLFAADAAINTWQLTILDLGSVKEGLTLRINGTFLVGAVILLIAFAIQHRGISSTAKVQTIIGAAALMPLIIIGVVPLLTGDVVMANLTPLVPLAHDAADNPVPGAWTTAGFTVMAGGLFIAAWSTYAFETAVCYTREFRDPGRDTFKAILASGILCILVFSIVPLTFQGVLGLEGMLAPEIYDGTGVAAAMAAMVDGGPLVETVIVVMLVFSLVLAIITSMAGSSRTLYQAAKDGWLPRYLDQANENGAPTRAMWTDLGFNLVLLMMSDYVFVLAISNVCYIMFNFLNLNSGWIHRLDRPTWDRPFRAPTWLLAIGTAFSFVNLVFLGMGANIWGEGTLVTGVLVAAMILPVFVWRHYVVDKGHFPDAMKEDLHLGPGQAVVRRAGVLPYLALAAGVAVVLIANAVASSG
ncbi:APC family permease [Chthonobacter rhizosphaerae]|uniref:APC family permease n=1 Tax=Chthonobacter rhizosphaerae TaxID=2735553 RepID=UPI0015EFBACC|nr:APC family permease [Chthonobacter rhizosphaerae]